MAKQARPVVATTRRFTRTIAAAATLALVCLAGGAAGPQSAARADSQAPAAYTPIDQGPQWTPQLRAAFYSVDQGSRIMPLAWMRALKQADGTPFLTADLARYGYLANPDDPDGLPVGFTAAGPQGERSIGMTCAACHTRQIEMHATTYRVDGGPAMVDFQTFLTDLDDAVNRVLSDHRTFDGFATAVLGANRTQDQADALHRDLRVWYHRYHTLMAASLPREHPWGYGRVDAMGMIINRLAGVDLGTPPTRIIADNIRPADAPVRYPFLWNVDRQACTQWLGFAHNDSDTTRLARNIGQVLGVFADFHPVRDPSTTEITWWDHNSVNVEGLTAAEAMLSKIGKPRFPGTLDPDLVAEGATVYARECEACHASDPGSPPWKTPVMDVGTDVRAMALLNRRVKTGILATGIVNPPFTVEDRAIEVLYSVVTGMLLSLPAPEPPTPQQAAARMGIATKHETVECGGRKGYEAKVLHGVWAAAPFLHNGSVPTLADLLKPAADRPRRFRLGSAYDPVRVGLAADQRGAATMVTTGCDDVASGRSNCGHEHGTDLDAVEKAALLEYLKSL